MVLAVVMSATLGLESTFAVSKPGTPKITSLAGRGNTITVKWSSAKNASGYDLYRNGTKIARTSAKSNKNTISASGKYTYKVRAYKKYKVKQKQYYNKQTCKWQTKKIKGAKKRTTKVTKYKYGKYSSAKSISVSVNRVDASSMRSEMLRQINAERSKAGKAPLVLDDTLNITAQEKAKDLFETAEFDHYSRNLGYVNNQLDNWGYTYDSCGENIAEGQASVDEVMYDWMHSAGHKANILDSSFTAVGIGYYNGEWVQQFAHPVIGMGLIPNTAGMSKDDALSALRKAGFEKIIVQEQASNTVATGKVISQDAPAGYLTSTKNTITIIVSTGQNKGEAA